MPDLHAEFAKPEAAADPLMEFLEEVDRMPSIRAVKTTMLQAAGLRPGMRLLDVGCGSGIEVIRLAGDHPEVSFTGLDPNPGLLAIARKRAAALANVEWVEARLEDAELPEGGFDVIRTERVLMFAAGPALGRQLDKLISLLRPGGRLVLFELDYGAMILPPGDHDDDVAREAHALMERAMPEPWAGRKIPVELAARGMADVTAEPYIFTVSEPVWRRIVHDTLRQALDGEPEPRPRLRAWLDDHAATAAEHPLRTAITGVLITARRPG
ncbi:methyltransferase domain-containing protein [Thermopolyspora sp. NPDC052614]|uniref:methyltransferase domain-containing protein n=1 Tax=Thermopolyspora sp. NPDC052614 TaxID=3155682 RepID=UPI00342C8537